MTNTTGIARAGYEPIPGYVLRQRLGAGGYGEVWSADAPGGLQKAVKLVYGSMDQHRASSELKSLQRIRQVHHPFLLSIERIEVVDSQLIIVSELAESSLVECFHASRRRQLQGIPRDQLLDFMRDAGDALDYLSQKHDLQHLDVKPGNLLIMADRIKVADFGLIKDLHDQNVSIISGLTPSHAAPEIFEGRPDRLSDLYSLAIVYQEMLTGKLPFDGKTAGELARQHLHQPPNLEPLPPADRRVVARALSKHPLDRFPSCRAFIDELRRSNSHEKYTVKSRPALEDSNDAPAEDSQEHVEPTISATSTSPAASGTVEVMPPLSVVDSAEGWQAPFCMFIGVGGIGGLALTNLRSLMKQKVDNRRQAQDHQWLAIDTDFDLLSEVSSDLHPGALDYAQTLHLRLYRPQDYRERTDDRFGPISRRWLYNIPRSLKTEGVRPLGMLTLLDHYEEVQSRIYRHIKQLLADRHSREGEFGQPVRIYICGSIHGGTGSAIMSDVGLMVRRALSQLKCEDYRLSALVTVATTTNANNGFVAAAAGMACMNELQAHMESTVFVPPLAHQLTSSSASHRPFDWVTLIEGGMHGISEDVSLAIDSLGQALWIDSHTLIGPTLDPVRDSRRSENASGKSSSGRSWLRTERSSIVQLGQAWRPLQVARICCVEAFQRWNTCLVHQTSSKDQAGNRPADNESRIVGWAPSQTEAVIEHLSDECLRTLRFAVCNTALPNDIASMQNAWRNRVSQAAEAIRTQMERDVRAWRAWLGAQMRPTFVSWAHLNRVMLRAVDKLLTLADCDDETLLVVMQQDATNEDNFGARELKCARQYIRQLAQKYMQFISEAKSVVEQISGTFSGWIRSVQAEQNLVGAGNNIDLHTANLPLGWRHMLQRVHSVLDTTLQRFVVSRCFQSIRAEAGDDSANAGCITLDHVLRLSTDLLTKLMREAGLDIGEATKTPVDCKNTRTITIREIQSMVPGLVQRGGRAYRLVSVTARQRVDLDKHMQTLDMSDSCTIVPAQYGEEPCAVCEAFDFNIGRMASNYWHPTSETLRLAERLHTRCDVSWPPVEEILQCDMSTPVVS